MAKKQKPKCPGCNEADADYRQEDRPHLCAWCGYDNDKGEHTGFQSASEVKDDG